jgi:shikimate kinase
LGGKQKSPAVILSRSLYDQRQPLYRRYAQLTIDCTNKTHEQIVAEIVEGLTK